MPTITSREAFLRAKMIRRNTGRNYSFHIDDEFYIY